MTSPEERQTIHRMAEQGYTSQQIADALGWTISTVRKWRQLLKKGVRLIVKWGVLEKAH